MHHISRLLTTNWGDENCHAEQREASPRWLCAMCAWSLVGFEEILRYTQNDNTWRVIARTLVRGNLSHDEVLYNVMLSEVEASPRWLWAMCAWSMVGFEEILRYTQNEHSECSE